MQRSSFLPRVLALTLVLPFVAFAATPPGNAAGRAPVGSSQLPPATPQLPPATAPLTVSTTPALTVTPTKMTGISLSATHLMVGSLLTAKLNGQGDANNAACGSRIKIEQVGVAEEWNGYPGVSQTQEDSSKWPKTQVFLFKIPGHYKVRLGVYSGAPASCGYSGPGSVPGDLTDIEVVAAVAK